ncbi:gag-asp_proteas domain-containing protein [Gossypium australe]|uniref:Gag-asp_proteas domain-containing protein n=1 Tax=Gossypium australe TaxID=47621 RepID=A0A5B6VYR0_9ROSI|nr:gag-asp_proteas domain-containing protein [Gossypium australe]
MRKNSHKKLKKFERIKINASCNAITACQIPSKLKDIGSFTISAEIGNKHFSKALCDLGVNINLIPYPYI